MGSLAVVRNGVAVRPQLPHNLLAGPGDVHYLTLDACMALHPSLLLGGKGFDIDPFVDESLKAILVVQWCSAFCKLTDYLQGTSLARLFGHIMMNVLVSFSSS